MNNDLVCIDGIWHRLIGGENIKVAQGYETKYLDNKHSGHFTTEHILLKKWEVSTPAGTRYYTKESTAERAAQEYRDFYNKFNMPIPISEREWRWAESMGKVCLLDRAS